MDFIDLKTQYKKYKAEIDRQIHEVLDSSQYIMGPKVHELETVLAEFANVKHCVSASSGTDTLTMSLMALGVGPGDEVITTPFTFISTVEVIAFLGAIPRFVDIDLSTFNLRIDQVEQKITPKTKAILPVSLFGQVPDLDALNEIANRYNLPVIEDGAQSFGATRNGKMSCGMTTVGSTSFFPAKPLGCYGDGGAIFTDDDHLAKKMKEIRNHGGIKKYEHTTIGINGRCDTIQAAVLLAKLPHFPIEIQARQRIGERYNELLQDVCIVPQIEEGATSTYACYTIRSKNRDEIVQYLRESQIPTAIYYQKPLYRQPAYEYLSIDGKNFPNTEQACKEVLSLPIHPWLTDEVQDKIVQKVKEAHAKFSCARSVS